MPVESSPVPSPPPLRLSVLDLSPVPSGESSADALRHTLDLARLTDELGYTRYWLSEHHNTPLLASASPEILIGHIAGATTRLRVGSGGIMLPNHPPLHVAESFRMLEALHPGRIDLGLGRAPGTDGLTARALRGGRGVGADDFPLQLAELLGFFGAEFPADSPYRQITAIPADVPPPALWMLGSSDYGAIVAAQEGLGFAFAHHINPVTALRALRLYHERFQPSRYFSQPQAIVAVSVICAPTSEEAEALATSADLTWLRIHQNQRTPLPSVAEAQAYPYTIYEREFLRENRNRLFVGSPAQVREQLSQLAAQGGVDEIMVTSLIHDHEARRQSYMLLAQEFGIERSH